MMGWHLAQACTFAPAPISDAARIVLCRMAWAALDKPSRKKPAATYWGGWEYLGLSWEHDAKPDAVRRKVTRAVAELVAAGLVRPLGTAHRGNRQSYEITVPY